MHNPIFHILLSRLRASYWCIYAGGNLADHMIRCNVVIGASHNYVSVTSACCVSLQWWAIDVSCRHRYINIVLIFRSNVCTDIPKHHCEKIDELICIVIVENDHQKLWDKTGTNEYIHYSTTFVVFCIIIRSMESGSGSNCDISIKWKTVFIDWLHYNTIWSSQ